MAKAKTKFVCQNCSAQYPKWQGQCNQCGKWNSLVEEIIPATDKDKKKSLAQAGAGQDLASLEALVEPLPDKELLKGSKSRLDTRVGELNRVLGGGLVPGSVSLIGGEPGIGKSTLLTQTVLQMLLAKNQGAKLIKSDNNEKQLGFGSVFYVCGEESPVQISLRIKRMLSNEQYLAMMGFGKDLVKDSGQKNTDDWYQFLQKRGLKFVTTNDVDQINALISQKKPDLVIVDSIQTVSTQDLTGASGSVGQIRECTERLTTVAKKYSIPLFLVGHVTKEGVIAGPKVLEHIVDTVLELSGERTGQFRMLRALKNRFGATDEVGVFKVTDFGLQEVSNPSELFLENHLEQTPGSAVVCSLEGTRPLLLEVQALVNSSQLPMPRRVGRGIQLSRIQVLAAVLQKHCGLPLDSHDIFLSAAGGFSLKEPAIDLGLAMAIASSLKNKKLPQKTIFIGEIGLLGEVRPVSYLERRVKEARRLGFEQIIASKKQQTLKKVLQTIGLK